VTEGCVKGVTQFNKEAFTTKRKRVLKTNFKTAVPAVRPPWPASLSFGTIPAGWTMLCALLLVFSAHGNTLTWSGGAAPNGNWNNSANWGGVGIPGNGARLFSPARTRAPS
jgi:hypothetical protein